MKGSSKGTFKGGTHMMESSFMFDSEAIYFLDGFQRKVQGDLLALCTDLCQDPWQHS